MFASSVVIFTDMSPEITYHPSPRRRSYRSLMVIGSGLGESWIRYLIVFKILLFIVYFLPIYGCHEPLADPGAHIIVYRGISRVLIASICKLC